MSRFVQFGNLGLPEMGQKLCHFVITFSIALIFKFHKYLFPKQMDYIFLESFSICQKIKDDLDILGGIYWHVSVFILPLGNLEF